MFLRTGVAVLEAIRRMTKFNYVLFLINKQIPLGKELTKSRSFQIQTCTITIDSERSKDNIRDLQCSKTL